ncbi:hypothetical protein V3C99_009995 [Haemonchus contortus]
MGCTCLLSESDSSWHRSLRNSLCCRMLTNEHSRGYQEVQSTISFVCYGGWIMKMLSIC